MYVNFEIVKKFKKRESANKYIARLYKSKTMSKYFTHKENCNQSQNQSQKAATELCSFTHMVEQGTDINLIQRIAGHSSVKTTAIYTHISHSLISKIQSPINLIEL